MNVNGKGHAVLLGKLIENSPISDIFPFFFSCNTVNESLSPILLILVFLQICLGFLLLINDFFY